MPLDSAWASSLQEATFKGIGFEVTGTDYDIQRRIVVHELPFADLPMVEDVGLDVQRIKISGFLNGDDVYDQRDDLERIAKARGKGELIHPSRGSLICTLLTASFSETIAEGRQVGLELDFVVTPPDAKKSPQSLATNGAGVIQDQAGNVQAAAQPGFFGQLKETFGNIKDKVVSGVAAVKDVVKQVKSYVKDVTSVMQDASRFVHSVGNVVNMIPGLKGTRFAKLITSAGSLGPIGAVFSKANQAFGTFNKITNAVNGLTNIAAKTYRDVGRASDHTVALVHKL